MVTIYTKYACVPELVEILLRKFSTIAIINDDTPEDYKKELIQHASFVFYDVDEYKDTTIQTNALWIKLKEREKN